MMRWLSFTLRFLCLTCLIGSASPFVAAQNTDGGAVLLVASEDMGDPRFRRTVVVATRHGRNQASIGVIFNQPLEHTLERALPPGAPKSAANHRLHIGGPVAQGRLVYLVRGEKIAPKDSIPMVEQLYFASDREGLLRMLETTPLPSRLRVFNGIATWAPNQLEREIARGDWHVLPLDPDFLFDEPLDGLWAKLWRRATQVMAHRDPAPCASVNRCARRS